MAYSTQRNVIQYDNDNFWLNLEELNREDFCKDCEQGICLENCRKCPINALTDYKPRILKMLYENMIDS
jgi:hypothetical protein